MRIRKQVWVAGIILLVIALVAGLWLWKQSAADQLEIVSDAPDFTLQNLEGKDVTFSDLKGKTKIVEFIFTNCPDVCPTTTAQLVQIQKQLKEDGLFGKDVEFVTITFDPERDTPEVLKKHAEAMGIDQNGWSILRGDVATTKKVVEDYWVYAEKQPDGSFIHSSRSLFLIDEKNQIRKIYSMGEEMPREEILADIKTLEKGFFSF
ncbi:SCO family protein [Tumebacillus lipolyticus]|uniref:SCO family protein n=1 Tax=Tumebacillus lipolyticus TaxID=1280370 RepID=A0ABW4ZR67_9BACL